MQIRYDFFCNFLLLSSGPDTTYQQILLKFLLFETSSINSTRLFNFAEKVRFFLRHRVMVLTFTINSSVEIRFNFRGNFELLCLRLLWSLTHSSGFPVRFGRCHQHRLFVDALAPRQGAGTGRWRAPELGADGQPPAAALPGQLCCQSILLYLLVYTMAAVMLNCKQREMQQGI